MTELRVHPAPSLRERSLRLGGSDSTGGPFAGGPGTRPPTVLPVPWPLPCSEHRPVDMATRPAAPRARRGLFPGPSARLCPAAVTLSGHKVPGLLPARSMAVSCVTLTGPPDSRRLGKHLSRGAREGDGGSRRMNT